MLTQTDSRGHSLHRILLLLVSCSDAVASSPPTNEQRRVLPNPSFIELQKGSTKPLLHRATEGFYQSSPS